MKILLIVVVFNFETGSELESSMDFTDMDACHVAALETFTALDEAVEVRPMEIPEGQEMLDGTMIAYDGNGGELGMYACNVLRSAT